MLFSVIYDFDISLDRYVHHYAPPHSQKKLWQMTECHFDSCDGDKTKHRKYCALLTKEEFEAFVSDLDLVMDSCDTMGSLGAPGFGFGWAPAFNFRGTDYYAFWQSAYVTPIPGVSTREAFDTFDPKRPLDGHWDLLKQAMLSKYGG